MYLFPLRTRSLLALKHLFGKERKGAPIYFPNAPFASNLVRKRLFVESLVSERRMRRQLPRLPLHLAFSAELLGFLGWHKPCKLEIAHKSVEKCYCGPNGALHQLAYFVCIFLSSVSKFG